MYVCVCMHVYEHVYVFMGFQGVQFWFQKIKQTKREYVCMYVCMCMNMYMPFKGLQAEFFSSNSSSRSIGKDPQHN